MTRGATPVSSIDANHAAALTLVGLRRREATRMRTLQRYILGELLWSFTLTLLALTCLFTLAGGLVSVLRVEGVSARNLNVILPLLLPIILTVTMPVAAIFAATMVYGRLSADNELTACRAAGVNIHRLFRPALLLALFVALFSLLCINFVIPYYLKRLDAFARANLPDIVFEQLRSNGHVRIRDEYFLAAESVSRAAPEALAAKNFPIGEGLGYLWISNPTFLQVGNDGQPRTFIAAEGGLAQFDTRSSDVLATIYVTKARMHQVGRSAAYFEEQKIGPAVVPRGKPPKPSLVDLATLLRLRERPWESERLTPNIREFLIALRHQRFAVELTRRLNARESVELVNESGYRHELSASSARASEGGARLVDAQVVVHDLRFGRPTIYRAAETRLEARAGVDGVSLIELSLLETDGRPVLTQRPQAANYNKPEESSAERIDGLRIPETILAELQEITPQRVADRSTTLPIDESLDWGKALAAQRRELADKVAAERRKVISVLHFRMSFAGSALVTVLMGAALGVLFRGGQALAAFGIACIPLGAVTILIMMGRQLAENAGGETVGALVIWGGLALVALADGLILLIGVKR